MTKEASFLFKMFMFMFFTTFVITILGITNVISIEKEYLTPLYITLLLEIVASVKFWAKKYPLLIYLQRVIKKKV